MPPTGYTMDSKGDFKAAWNTSESLIGEIGRLRTLCDNQYIKGQIKSATRTLLAIKMCVVHNFNSEELKEINKLRKELIQRQIIIDSYDMSGFNKIPNDDYVKKKAELDYYYELLNDKIQELLGKYGYLIDKREDRTKLTF